MLALTWVISITISSPIALGMNYTGSRLQTPTLCTFYNSDFLIFSSMGSFYIPSVIMTILYWRIFYAIHTRARKSATSMSTALSQQRQQARCRGVENNSVVGTSLMTISNEQPEAEVESKWPLIRHNLTVTTQLSQAEAVRDTVRRRQLDSDQG